jgi:hypothetical protein
MQTRNVLGDSGVNAAGNIGPAPLPLADPSSISGESMMGACVACEWRNHERGANADVQGLGLTPPSAHRTVLRRPRRSR